MIDFTFRKKAKRNPLLEQKRDPQRYEQEKILAQSDNPKDRLRLAKSEDTHKEILYFLADQDDNEAVRKAVAKNHQTPIQASKVIAKDKSIDVRMALLRRLCDLLPDLSEEEYTHLYAHAVQALSNLALDEVLKIRKALASSLKDKAYCPPKLAATLAKDIEREVSEPILKYCVAIPDMDLIDILKATKYEWVARAIAQRETIADPVSKAVVDRADDFPKATEDLLKNKRAQINRDTMSLIIEKAKEMPEWHSPLAFRQDLPADMAQKIVSFVSQKIRKKMLARKDFDERTINTIEETTQRRAAFLTDENGKSVSVKQKLDALIKDNRLDEEAISDALGMREYEFVLKALAHLSKIQNKVIQKIVSTKTPKAAMALCWRAGMSTRFAVRFQTELVKIDPKEILYPKGGEVYPLTEDAMLFQLDFLEDS
tara:strand:+ start:1672 stop:2955 length:1284 start_codon:yes stop_codon:yes gene_type:complete